MYAILMLPVLEFSLCSLTFSFVHQLQKAENTIFWVIENIFHSGLDVKMILYIACFVWAYTLKVSQPNGCLFKSHHG
jgi:hypothetical protein